MVPVGGGYEERDAAVVRFDGECGAVRFHWSDGASSCADVRMGMCWPKPVIRQGRPVLEGYIVTGGYDIATQVLKEFDGMAFRTVTPVLAEDGSIAAEGLDSYLRRNWSKYLAWKIYYNQNAETHYRNLTRVLETPLIEPKPTFIEVPWGEEKEGLHAVWNWGLSNRFAGRQGSPLADALKRSMLGPDDIEPCLWALTCLVMSYERYPYRKRE